MPRTIWNHFHYTMILLHTSKCWLWSLEVWQFWQRCHLHEMEFSHEGRSFVRLRRKLQLLRSNTSTRNAPRRCNPLRFQIYFFRFLLLISFHCWCYHFKIWNIPSLVFVLFLILVLVPWSLSLSFCYHRHCHRPPTCHCPHQQHLGIKCNSHKRIWSTLPLCKSVFTKVLMGDFDYKCILQNLHKCTFQCHSCPSPLSSSQHSLLWKYTYILYGLYHILPGFPEPAVMWYHGTMKLVPTNNIVTVTTGRRNKLTFLRSALFKKAGMTLCPMKQQSLKNKIFYLLWFATLQV